MWWFLFPHCMYHLIRWFPKNNRLKIRILILLLSVGFLLPQFYVLLVEQSSRYCGQHLFGLLIASIVVTFVMLGFTFLFVLMDPIPFEVKFAFNCYGGLTCILGVLFIILSSLATECQNNTPILYYYSLATAVLSGISIGIYALLLPFWILNRLYRNSVLDKKGRTGICYEPVNCCSCIWHV
ncbi:uncharacterized protein [Apostichopus japonicus]|uniref:uncharacterized protein n=1 Tax=Stichopus japonicus TaxID=307972 RepID=UPI003AB8CCFE